MTLDLPEPYSTALRLAVAYIQERYAPVGIVASGTILRGTPQASSDLDLVVVHEPAWRQRTQRFFNGVPAEMFVNPAFQIRHQMARDTAAGRPVMAHMLATGTIVNDPTGLVATLIDEARTNLASGPAVPPESLLLRRYGIATAFEDASDIRDIDPDRAHTILTESLVESAKLHFLQQGRWLPRSKTLLSDLEALDPDLGAAVRVALQGASLDERIALARPVVAGIAGAAGFFEWESEPQDLARD